MFLYTLGIRLYGLALWLAAPFHPKARLWVRGRKAQKKKRQSLPAPEIRRTIWFHCASLGEFEQGRNLIEALKQDGTAARILLTFFSPSGYEVRKNYPYADIVVYLPLDTPENARAFLDEYQPNLAIFVKYELWLNFLSEINRRQIPLLLVSARVGADSAFLNSPFKKLYRRAFANMTAIFTQDEASATLLSDFSGNKNIIAAGDTRYDRVASNRAEWLPMPEVVAFIGKRKCVVCGSTWPVDVQILSHIIRESASEEICWIIAPHEIEESHLVQVEELIGKSNVVRYSAITDRNTTQPTVLLIDNIGMLSRLYGHAQIAYVGGAFGRGLHNILEPAAYGCPVIFGPKVAKFPEAAEIMAAGGGFLVQNEREMAILLAELLRENEKRATAGAAAAAFVQRQKGATSQIIMWLQRKF